MHLTLHGRNMHVAGYLEEYIERKVGKLDHYLPTLREARVDVSQEQTRDDDERYVVQVTLYDNHGTIIRGEERTSDVRSAVDLVIDKLHRQIRRYKGKRKNRQQRGMNEGELWATTLPVDEQEAEAESDEPEQHLVRTKRFAMSPMNTDEAIEQMELLGHTFFVYYDADHGSVRVVYRRRDGNYGLIVPEME